MCSSIDADEVKELITTSLTDAQINEALNIAYYMALPLTNELDDCGAGDMQCHIIKMVARHLITVREGQAKSESIGGEWSATYRGGDGTGLEASLFGQQALAMDCSGTLASLAEKRAEFEVISQYQLDESSYLTGDSVE